MGKTVVLYNPLSNNNKGNEVLEKMKTVITGTEFVFMDITKISDMDGFIKSVDENAKIVIAGGDGTLNNFVNACENFSRDIYFYPCGNGNDFARDINSLGKVILVNKYIKNLPCCMIGGKILRYLNGVGLGFDGYVCSKVNETRKKEGKNANYVGIALKGVINEYKTTGATVWVDDKKYEFEKVWLCATMKGRFYGGGFMMAPKQDRLSEDGKISLVVVHHAPLPKILYAFLLVFKGKHTKLKKSVTILTGDNIKVEFDKPSPLQLDGETYSDVVTYSVSNSYIKELAEV